MTEYPDSVQRVRPMTRPWWRVPSFETIRTGRREVMIGLSLLLLSFLAGLAIIYWGVFSDEMDNLVVGAQLARGTSKPA